MKPQHSLCLLSLAVIVSGCASTAQDKAVQLDPSYLQQSPTTKVQGENGDAILLKNDVLPDESSVTRIAPLSRGNVGFKSDVAIADMFATNKMLTIAAEDMPLQDFLHYSFGDLLAANYIVGDGLADKGTVTLNVQEQISAQKLYKMIEQLLLERGVTIKRQNDLLYIGAVAAEKNAETAVGYGRLESQVPNAVTVMQIVPLRYVFNQSVIKTLRDVTGVKANADTNQGVLFINGERSQVLKAIDLMGLLDTPGSRSRHIAVVKLTYINANTFITSVNEILKNEGLMTDPRSSDNRVSFVELGQLGAVAAFATESEFIDRIEYWAKTLDQPSKGTDLQYFVYTPKFARASDLGMSVSTLITGRGQSGGAASSAQNQQAQQGSQQRAAAIENRAGATAGQSTVSANTETMKMVVDERSNTLIFHTSGMEYRAILPLVERLDVMPKQVILEMTIAEVNLTDEFRFGVESAFSSGKFDATLPFATAGGGLFGWSSGNNKVDVRAFESNGLVNILSKPTILVRDGVEANIEVGDEIPTTGKTVTDPTNGTIREVNYRQTGLKVSVTPTINAQGVVIMTISQNNDTAADGGADADGNPIIFNRALSTEVVAESGQTIILGGLISEDKTDTESGVPLLSKLPLIGRLFGSLTQTVKKKELVMMVTPRVVSRSDEWEALKTQFGAGLEFIQLPENTEKTAQ
ncbi:secretin N-terminal domain-containing protein [Rheinheimera sp.]|uniref:secretin N-terminal domain-containing protein n=1 Tax=Rheinheimera sp. TaxID=1869214 RepID=UPI0027B933AD|nr:secretin N-terminal domain-containing protein [Rheinheimera sp.]